jgi:hypothetical protein
MGAGSADRGQCLAGLSLYQGRLIVTDRLTPGRAQSQQQEATMMLLASNYDQSRFLNAVDLDSEKKFRIKEVTEEELGQDRDKTKKLVVWFTNDKRGLVLNKTNNRVLRGAFGNDCSAWKDKIVVVFPTTVEFRGKMVPGLRVRIPAPKQAATSTGNGQAAVTAAAPQPTQQPASQLDEFGQTQSLEKPSLSDDPDDEILF